jgi:polysaccharide biosynthesis protein PslH
LGPEASEMMQKTSHPAHSHPAPPRYTGSAEQIPARAVATAHRPLHVVVVDEELPYPPVTGKRLRTFKLLIRLARRHRITYICHRNADTSEARLAAMLFADHNIQSITVDRTIPSKSGLRFYARLAGNLLSPLPYSVATHSSPEMRLAVQSFAAAQGVDLWQCEWTPYAAILRHLPGARRLVMAHNVESMIWQRYYEHESNPVRRWYIKKQWRKFQQFERQAFVNAHAVVAVSPEDAALIAEQVETARVEVVDNGVDTGYFRPQADRREAGRILFLGSLDWRPNLDAVHLLLDQIFPKVLQDIPSAKLLIVGRNPPPWLRRRISGRTGVELHADVPDVRPYLAQSGVLVVPLRIGGGSRLKILEAGACGLPVVSTRVGAEGLSLEPGRHLTVVDDVNDMAAALVSAIGCPGPGLAMAISARNRILERYDWDVLANRLEQVWLNTAHAHARQNGQTV